MEKDEIVKNEENEFDQTLSLKDKFKSKREKLEKKYHNSNDSAKDNIDQDDETAKSIPYKSFKKLQLATRSTIEMESMTGNILGNLNNQTSQMKGVTNKLGLMNNDIDSSSGILTKMIVVIKNVKKLFI